MHIVAKAIADKSIIRELNWNVKKGTRGAAACLHAGILPRDAAGPIFLKKLEHFNRLNDLNTRAKTSTFHISLNFDSSEKQA